MATETTKQNVLFLCTGNSCRSQMAEGWARHYWADRYNVYSAGIETHGMNPRAMLVMREAGIDIASHASETVQMLGDVEFDYVVTVCDHAARTCPHWPAKVRVVHAPFEDPPKLAANATNEQEALAPYRRVRDAIREYVLALPKNLAGDEG